MDYTQVLFWLLVVIIILCAIVAVRVVIKGGDIVRGLIFPLGIAALAIAGIIWLR